MLRHGIRAIGIVSNAVPIALAVLFGAAIALRLTQVPPHAAAPRVDSNAQTLPSALPSLPGQSPMESFDTDGMQANVLELPTASTDFVGEWGGHVHCSIERASPELIGTGPDRVSVIFGRHGRTVFMTSELYSSPAQTIVRRPTARIPNERLAVVKYESADQDLYYVAVHYFRLGKDGRIIYRSTISVYNRRTQELMAIVRQRATLKRLLTAREQLQFAQPSRQQIPRASISASDEFVTR